MSEVNLENVLQPGKSSESTIESFLRNRKLKKGDKSFTHTALGEPPDHGFPASYSIQSSDYDLFYKLYNQAAFSQNKKLYLTEKHEEYSPILIDLDFRFDSNIKTRKYTSNTIIDFLKLYVLELQNLLNLDDEKLQAFVMEKTKPLVQKERGITKDGIHIVFPYIITEPKIQYIIRHNLLNSTACKAIFEEISVDNSIEEIIDLSVIEKNNWQMYGSRKPKYEAYKLTNILSYMAISKDFKFVSIDTVPENKLVKLLSIRGIKLEDVSPINSDMVGNIDKLYEKLPAKHRLRKKRAVVKKKRKTPNTKNYSDNLSLVEQLVDILDPYRADIFETWIRLGWCLHNIDYRLLNSWINFSKKSSKFEEGTCEKEWDSMDNDGLGMGSLYLWAKEDNYEKYKEITRVDLRCYLLKSLNSTHHDIAKVIYQMFKHDFVCSSSKRKNWFQFTNNRWVELDDCVELKRKISNDVVDEYLKLSSEVAEKAYKLDGDDPNKEIEMDRVKKLSNIALQLRKCTFKKNVLEECMELFYVPKFEEKLDNNVNLIGFENGVYDLETGEFRNGLPEDYIKNSTGINYEEYDMDDETIIEIDTFLSQILPIPKVKDYLQMLLSSFLSGKTGEEKFHIWTGSGGNGKSKLIELFELSFGDYCCTLPITLLTQQRARAESCNPSLAKTKGKRFACLQEPDPNEEIKVGQMKELTGGDTITARGMYKEPIEFKPQFKLVLTCNDLPSIPAQDRGTWRRIRVVEFISKFMDSPNPNNQYEFPIDTELSEKLREWPEGFMYMLLETYKKYKKFGLHEPSEVMKNTASYQNESDIFSQFVNEKIIELDDYSGKSVKLDDVYTLFTHWFKHAYGNSNKCPSRKDVRKNMNEKFGKCDSTKLMWKGLSFRNDEYETF